MRTDFHWSVTIKWTGQLCSMHSSSSSSSVMRSRDGCNVRSPSRTVSCQLQSFCWSEAAVIGNLMKPGTVHRCLQGRAPQYLMNCCHPTSDVASRQRLRSSSHHHLVVPRHCRSSADNFRKGLKIHLFRNALGHSAHKRRCVMRYINLRLTYLLTYLLGGLPRGLFHPFILWEPSQISQARVRMALAGTVSGIRATTPHRMLPVVSDFDLPAATISSYHDIVAACSAVGRSPSPVQWPGTRCLTTFETRRSVPTISGRD